MSKPRDPPFEETLQEILTPGGDADSSTARPEAAGGRTRVQDTHPHQAPVRRPSRHVEALVRIIAALVGVILLLLFAGQIVNR